MQGFSDYFASVLDELDFLLGGWRQRENVLYQLTEWFFDVFASLDVVVPVYGLQTVNLFEFKFLDIWGVFLETHFNPAQEFKHLSVADLFRN